MPIQDTGFGFDVTHANGFGPRAGRLVTPRGDVETPCFLPIASHGTLRAMSFDEARDCGTRFLMANAWHVHREVGADRLREAGGVHRVMGWSGLVVTDSGGYQVFSLRENATVSDDLVAFGGGSEPLTPEDVIFIQKCVGADFIFALDDCAPYPCTKRVARDAVRRTTLWAGRCLDAHNRMPPQYGYAQELWGIVQGGVHPDLRKRSVDEVAALDFAGYGIGGLSIGMPKSAIREMTRLVCELLPQGRSRHLLGVGLPGDILDGIEDGADSFDCVLPIRKGQRGVAYTSVGVVTYKRAPAPGLADAPLDPSCDCPTCRACTRDQLWRLYLSDKPEAGRLASIHNVAYYHRLLDGARAAIRDGRFSAYKRECEANWADDADS